MLTRVLSLVALIILITLAAIALPNWIQALSMGDVSPSAIFVSGLFVVIILAGAVMLLLFGVIGVNSPQKELPVKG